MATKPNKTCLVQVILEDFTAVQVELPLEFFTKNILGKSLNFMSDIPPHLLEFADRLDEIVRQSKIN